MDDKIDSFRKSKWSTFDLSFAKMIKAEHPDIWDEGGNIKGNDQYEILSKIVEQGGVAKTDAQIAALELREAWIARHKEDFRLPGVIAQIKWLAVGSRGQEYMKNLVKETIKKREKVSHQMTDNIDISMEDFLEHFGVKGMKWGVRREDRSSNNKSSPDKKSSEKDINWGAVKRTVAVGAGVLGVGYLGKKALAAKALGTPMRSLIGSDARKVGQVAAEGMFMSTYAVHVGSVGVKALVDKVKGA